MFHGMTSTTIGSNPFDPKTILLARHAQHVVFIHFPIALYMAAVVFDVMAQWRGKKSWSDAAEYNFLLAAMSVPPVIVTGLFAWRLQFAGEKLRGLLLLHLGFASVASLFIVTTCWLYFEGRRTRVAARVRFALEGAAVAAIILASHLGGFLSGVNHSG